MSTIGSSGDNGTVKVHRSTTEADDPRNEPHVCGFYLVGFQFDAGQQVLWRISSWPPTGNRAEVLHGTLTLDARIARLAKTLRRAMEEDPGFTDDLDATFQRAVDEDPEFRAMVSNRLRRIRVDATANDEGVTNVFNGTAENIIQPRDVHGGLPIN